MMKKLIASFIKKILMKIKFNAIFVKVEYATLELVSLINVKFVYPK